MPSVSSASLSCLLTKSATKTRTARLVSSADTDTSARITQVFEGELGGELWALTTLAGRLAEVLAQAASAAEPSHLARYALSLAQSFNTVYNRRENRVLEEKDPTRRAVLVVVFDFVRKQLTSALGTLGIEVPERM